MEAFDYAMGLVSIVVGIAISDLAISFTSCSDTAEPFAGTRERC